MSDQTGFVSNFNVSVTANMGDGATKAESISAGTTIGDWFTKFAAGQDPKNFRIRVNGEQVAASYELKPSDEISVIYAKIAAGVFAAGETFYALAA